MKRMKVFIIAIISVLLIVSLGNVKLAHEATVIKSIGSDGKVGIKLNDLKTKYANVLCVERSTSVKHGSHGNTKDSEYYLVGTADIVGNSATLTEYTWDSKWDKIIKTRTTENDIITNNGANNTMAAILTTNNFENGYAGTNYNENGILEEEEASYGPRQLCTWGYWNTWVESLPQEWQGVFKACDKNRLKTEQENTWFNNDMAVINSISAFYTYKVKISFIEHICKDSNGNIERIGQHLILFEVEDPQVEITVEKIWDDIIYDENGNIIADNSGNRPTKLDVLVETYMTELNETDTIYDNMVHIEGEDKIVELTEANHWKSTLKLKVKAGKEGYTSLNRIYKVREVVEIQDGQNVKVDVVKVPQGEEPKVEKTFDQEKDKYVQIVTVGGKIVCKTYKEPLVATFPKVEVKEENGERILYVAGKKVVKSAYVGNVEVEDVLNVNGYKITLKGNEKYVEPQTEEEIKNRTDTPIQNKKYAVVKQEKVLLNSSYILEDQTMIQVSDNSEYGSTEYNQYVESNIDVEDKKVDMTNTGAYVRLKNKLELVNIPVKKVWNCSDKSKIPEKITIQLLANDKIVKEIELQTNGINTLGYTFENLIKYDQSGNEIKYTIKEIEIDGFASEITGDMTKGFTITNTYFDGYYEINGKVWYDGELGKSSTGNKILDDADIGMEGIKVTLMYGDAPFYSEGGKALSVATTGDNGEYTIKVNYDNRVKIENGESNLYKLYEPASKVEEKLSDGNAWIKFEYDGMAYTTVEAHDSMYKDKEFLPTNTSKASEDINERARVDGNKDAKDPGYSIVNSGTPEIKFVNTSGIPSIEYPEQDPNGYWKNTTVFASTKGFIGSFIDKGYEGVKTYNSELIKEDKSTEIIKYCKGDTDNNGLENYIYTDAKQNSTTVGNGKHDCTNCNKTGHIMKQQEVKVTKINGVNLGLAAREKQDVKIDSTVTKVDIAMQGHTQSYKYNEMKPTIDINSEDMYEEVDKYVRRLNTANVILAYQAKQNSESSEELISAYVTYAIAIKNQSGTLRLGVDSIINDFDSRYEIDKVQVVTLNDAGEIDPNVQINELKPDQIKITDIVAENGVTTHKRALLSGLGIEAEAECNSKQVILIRYKVNYEAILEVLLHKTVLLNNAVEVDSYRSEYSEETLYYADDHLNEQYAVRGKNYAGYDKDSHPGNAQIVLNENGMLESKNLIKVPDPEAESGFKIEPEDDTDIAPQFDLILDDPRTISGTVWEDTDIKTGTNSEAGTYRLGNGIKDSAERNLANVKVELINAVGEKANEVAKVYKYHIDENNEIITEAVDAIVYTDKFGNYSFKNINGNDGYSIPTGVDAKYYVRFIYGNAEKTTSAVLNEDEDINAASENIRNARNFKSTIISNDSNTTLYNYFKNGVGDDMWYLDIPDNASVAVDDIETRRGIDQDLVYGNFNQDNSMFATSKIFIMPIEWTRDSQIDVESDEKLPCESTVFDFGIIERAREDLYVSKTITDMEVILANGSKLAEGDPSNKDQLNFVKAQRLSNYIVNNRAEALLKSQRQAMLEMDSEITQGAKVNLKYAITVTNKSEIDIDYDKQHSNGYKGIDYYYYGEIPTDDTTLNEVIMASSVAELITYVNKDLEPNVNADDWTRIKDEEFNALRRDEFDPGNKISQNTYDAIKSENNGYYVYKTTAFADVKPGDSKTLQSIKIDENTMKDSMAASKRLTYKEDNAYDIHSEILVINGKVARTIDSVKDGAQIPKTYKSGNLVPSLEGRTVQEDDGYIKEDATGRTIEPVLSQDYESAGGHEQDDDSVKVTITQPTGITKYITTYVITTLIGLIVIVIGIVFIKKKVLTK